MSGGSWEYYYYKLEEVAERLLNTPLYQSCCAERIALGALLKKASEALHAIEWVDSCDYGPGDEQEPIRQALRMNPLELGAKELEVRIVQLRTALESLASIPVIKEAQREVVK